MNAPAKSLILFLSASLLTGCVGRCDTVYVWGYDGTITQFTSNGVPAVVTNNLSGWNGPVGLALDNVGNLYAGAPGDSWIWRFAPDGAGSLVGGDIDSVSGLAFDSSGQLHAAIPNFNSIIKLEYAIGHEYVLDTETTNQSTSNLNYPIDLAFDGAGRIYVANNSNNTVEVFSPGYVDLGIFANGTNTSPGLNEPWGIAFDNGSNLFVANSGNNKILKIAPNGSASVFAGPTDGLKTPRGLAFDSAGNLYVANSGSNQVLRITPAGSVSVFASGLNSPSSIAIFPGQAVWSSTPPRLNVPAVQSSGSFQFYFRDSPGLSFSVVAATNPGLPSTNWTMLGEATEVLLGGYPFSLGLYQFTDPGAANNSSRFYRVHSP